MRVRSFFFDIRPGGGGFSRKPGDQADTLLLRPGFRTRAIIKHFQKQYPSLSTKGQTRMNFLKCFRTYVPSGPKKSIRHLTVRKAPAEF
jgi:hypothetical protein